MAIAVRELPPTRLAVNVQPSTGDGRRWAADERRAENIPSGLTFTSSAPGGFESLSLTLPRRPRVAYPDLERLSMVTVSGAGQIAWEGRIEGVPATSGDTTGVSPEIVGWQAHLSDDKSVTAIYVDRDLNNWIQASGVYKNGVYGPYFDVIQDFAVNPDATTGLPEIRLSADGQWAVGLSCEAWYDCGVGNAWSSLYFDYVGRGVDGSFTGRGSSYTTDAGAGAITGTDLITGASPSGATTVTPSTAQRFAALQFLYIGAATAAADNKDREFRCRRVTVWGNTGLTKRGTAPDDGLYASDVIAHALSLGAPRLRFSTGTYGTISTSSYAVKQLVFREPTTAAEIISAVNRYMLADWMIWEGPRPGQPTFYYSARGARGRNWKARVGPSQLAETGQGIENLWNGVVVRYNDVDGTTKTVGPTGATKTDATSASLLDSDPLNAANRAGIRRWEVLDAGGVATLADATELGRRFLVEAREFNASGQAQIVGHCEDDRGIKHPAWQIRAGDTVTFTDAADTSPRRVIKTSYSDENLTCSIDLDAPPDALAALLERLQVVLVPLGL